MTLSAVVVPGATGDIRQVVPLGRAVNIVLMRGHMPCEHRYWIGKEDKAIMKATTYQEAYAAYEAEFGKGVRTRRAIRDRFKILNRHRREDHGPVR